MTEKRKVFFLKVFFCTPLFSKIQTKENFRYQERYYKLDAKYSVDDNLVSRVLGLFGQRVSARKDSGIMGSTFPENVGSGLTAHARV